MESANGATAGRKKAGSGRVGLRRSQRGGHEKGREGKKKAENVTSINQNGLLLKRFGCLRCVSVAVGQTCQARFVNNTAVEGEDQMDVPELMHI